MINIIKKGYLRVVEEPTYIKKCKICKTIFTYQYTDIQTDWLVDGVTRYIKCPLCEYTNGIIINHKYKGSEKHGRHK